MGCAAAHCKLISDAVFLVYSTCPAIKRSDPRGNISLLLPCKVIKGNRFVVCLLQLPGLINPFSVTCRGRTSQAPTVLIPDKYLDRVQYQHINTESGQKQSFWATGLLACVVLNLLSLTVIKRQKIVLHVGINACDSTVVHPVLWRI